MGNVKAKPDQFHSLTPHLIVKGARQAIDFYKKAFGAEEICTMKGPDGENIIHGEIKIGDSILMLCDECPDMGARLPQSIGGSPVSIHVYVDNVDQVFDRAVKAGAQVAMPVGDMFWGDRYGKLVDPFGHHWSIATHKEDLSPEEIEKRQKQFFAEFAGSKK